MNPRSSHILREYRSQEHSRESDLHLSEFARIYGVDFQSVLNRGSQFKVESVMFRIAKPESYLLLSPTREEVRLHSEYARLT